MTTTRRSSPNKRKAPPEEAASPPSPTTSRTGRKKRAPGGTGAAKKEEEAEAGGGTAQQQQQRSSSPPRRGRKRSAAGAGASSGDTGGIASPPSSPKAAGGKKKGTAAAKTKKAPAAATGGGAGRKRKKAKKSDDGAPSAAAAAAAATGGASTSGAPPAPVPSTLALAAPTVANVLVVDNGGDTIKYGWQRNGLTAAARDAAGGSAGGLEEKGTMAAAAAVVRKMPNRTARLQQQWTVLAGDEVADMAAKNPSQLVGLSYSTERGVVTDLGNQVQVWKRILDDLGVDVSSSARTSEAARALGWAKKAEAGAKRKRKLAKASKGEGAADEADGAAGEVSPPPPASACAVLITVPPLCPRVILDAIASVWLDDFGFGRVGFCVAPAAAAVAAFRGSSNSDSVSAKDAGEEGKEGDGNNLGGNEDDADFGTLCVVDLGWSSTQICPTLGGRAVSRDAVRRLPIGARHLINVWKYWTSYRHYNLMDQDFVLRDVLERTAFVSSDFAGDMEVASALPGGRRPYDLEYLLPDYHTTFEGKVRLPEALELRRKEEEEEADEKEAAAREQAEDEDDEDVDEEEMMKEDNDDENDEEDGSGKHGGEDESDDDDDDDEEEEESAEQIRRRVLEQRAEEERRRRELEEQQQVLNVSTERFAVPEILFHPQDAGLPPDWAGLPAAVVQSIRACPKALQPAMFRSILLVGGLSRLPGLKDRLLAEIRALAPCEYAVRILSPPPTSPDGSSHSSSSAVDLQVWHGARRLAEAEPCQKWSLSKQEWESYAASNGGSPVGVWKRFEISKGGHLV